VDDESTDSLDAGLKNPANDGRETRINFASGGYKAQVIAPVERGTLTVGIEADDRPPSAPDPFWVELRAPTSTDLEHRRIFGNRRATGAVRFDTEVFVISWGAPGVLRKILADDGVRQAALWLVDRGFKVKLSSRGFEATSGGPVERPDGGLVREVAARLAALARVFLEKAREGEAPDRGPERLPSWVPGAPRALARYDAQWQKAFFSAVVLAWALAFAVPLVFWTPVDLEVQLYMVALSVVLALPLVSRMEFEGHDRFDQGERAGGLRGALRKGFGHFLSAMLAPMMLVAPAAELATVGVNAIGAGPPVEHPTEVIEVLHSNILRVKGWQPGRPSETIHGKWTKYTPGEPVVVTARRGLWGWEFRSIRPAPASGSSPHP